MFCRLLLFWFSGWGDAVQVASTPSSVEWREEDSSGALAAGWSKDEDSKIPTTPMSQWGQVNESSWSNNFKVNRYTKKN